MEDEETPPGLSQTRVTRFVIQNCPSKPMEKEHVIPPDGARICLGCCYTPVCHSIASSQPNDFTPMSVGLWYNHFTHRGMIDEPLTCETYHEFYQPFKIFIKTWIIQEWAAWLKVLISQNHSFSMVSSSGDIRYYCATQMHLITSFKIIVNFDHLEVVKLSIYGSNPYGACLLCSQERPQNDISIEAGQFWKSRNDILNTIMVLNPVGSIRNYYLQILKFTLT